MRELSRVFALADIRQAAEYDRRPQFLIVTSAYCGWCQKFKAYWEEIATRVEDMYEVSTFEVEAGGGEEVFIDGFAYFFDISLDMPIGFPSMFRIETSGEIESLAPAVFWDADKREFQLESLIKYIQEGDDECANA